MCIGTCWGDMLEVFLDLFPLYLLRDQSLNPELTNLTCQAGQACRGEPVSPFLVLRLQVATTPAWLYIGSRNLNFGEHQQVLIHQDLL